MKKASIVFVAGARQNVMKISPVLRTPTDSGGIQEKSSFLSVPCLTLRENTECPATLTLGTNTLVGLDFAKARRLVDEILNGTYKQSGPILGWDGNALHRIVSELTNFLERRNLVSPILQNVY